MKTPKPKTRTVKAWAVVWADQPLANQLIDSAGLAIYHTQGEAADRARVLEHYGDGVRIVRCTITYTVPVPRRARKERA